MRKLEELSLNKVNTYPNLVTDSLLTFSSYIEAAENKNFDLFGSILLKTGKWSEPKAMHAFNSNKDETGLLFLGESSGYIGSNRDGKDEIFYFE